jgi:hypothetical protein
METFKYVVELEVDVEAFSETDAHLLLLDTFDVGEDCGVTITNTTIKDAD